MKPERWKRTEDLYHEACSRPQSDRAAFLAEACGDDEALRGEVESLLSETASDDGFLAGPALVSAARLVGGGATMDGRSLGGYHLESLLGAGGMGEVYRARDPKLGRDVAIKILPSAFTSDPDRLARFEREARMLAALNHPGICGIYGFEEADGVRFLILELIEGDTLAERIASVARQQPLETALPLAQTLTIARQIAEALEVAHEKGIIHRDLKPANIKITPHGLVKVLDFGLAKAVGNEGAAPDLTHAPASTRDGKREGALIGTAAYMSPEQARGLTVDKRTDIWAFGCVLYEMLTGRVAFAGETVSDSIAKILERDPEWSELPATTPLPVRRLLLRCLTKNPKQRLRDIGDVRIEIDAIDEVLPGATAAASVPSASAPARGRARWLSWIALALLVAGVVMWEVLRPVAPQDPFADARYSRFTDWEGREGNAEISPDGRFVAFVADRAGEFDLWLRQVGTGDFTNLTASLPPLSPPHPLLRTFGFSGDGEEIWFSLAGDPIRERKLLIPLTGGTPRAFLGEGATSPAWSRDATRLAYFQGRLGPDSAGGDPLFVADRTGADARQILASDDGMHNHNPTWSLDDRWLYFVHGTVRGLNWTDEMDVWRLRVSGGAPEQLTHQNTAVTFLAPLDERTLVYVARAEDGSGPWLWALDPARRITRRVSSGLEKYTSVAASRDGRRVVATIDDPKAGLWTVPILGRQAGEADVRPYPVMAARALAPRFGGQSLFFLSARGTGDGLWRFQDGQALEVRRGTDGPLFEPPAVSRDGSRVVVVLGKSGRRHLSIMSADGTGSRGLAESLDVEGTADWSPDGAWIAAGGNDDVQGRALFKIPVDGGAPVSLVTGQAVNPVWSPNGDLIVYAGPLAPGQVSPLLGVQPDGSPVTLPPVRVRTGGYRFLPDGNGLIYLPDNSPQSLDFWSVDLATGESRRLTSLSDRGRLGTFDVTPDGQHILFDRLRESSDVVLIDLQKRRE